MKMNTININKPDMLVYLFLQDLCIRNNRNYTLISNKFISNNLLIDNDIIDIILDSLEFKNLIKIKYKDKNRYIYIN